MNFEEKEKIRKNFVSLKKNILLPGELLDHLFEFGVISEENFERILSEKTSSDKVHLLLKILYTKPGCLGTFCESLDKSGYDFLAKAIRETEVDPRLIEEAEQELENHDHDILANAYETSSGGYSLPMQEILKEVEFGLSTLGKQWKENVLLKEELLQKLFPTAKPKKKEKKGNRSTHDPIYQCLKRKSENMEHQSAEEEFCRPQIHRQCVDKKTLEYRCVIGIPWSQVNLRIKAVVGATQLNGSFIPTANGAQCLLKEKLKSELFDLEILCVNECENDLDVMKDITTRMDRRKSVEAEFFKGASVTWWNLWFGEDHVLKRYIHTRLLEMVKLACSKSDNEDQGKVSIVTLYHQPGAGGTTSAKQILWELRKEYRCAVVKRISNFTCEQINRLRTFNEQETPKPPIVLIDNGDDDKLLTLCSQLENWAKIASRRLEDQCQVFCVLLLCARRPNLPSFNTERSVQLRDELNNVELDWFQKKGEFLKNNNI